MENTVFISVRYVAGYQGRQYHNVGNIDTLTSSGNLLYIAQSPPRLRIHFLTGFEKRFHVWNILFLFIWGSD